MDALTRVTFTPSGVISIAGWSVFRNRDTIPDDASTVGIAKSAVKKQRTTLC